MPYILQLLENNSNKGITRMPLFELESNNKIILQTIRDIDFSFVAYEDKEYTILLYKIYNKDFISNNWNKIRKLKCQLDYIYSNIQLIDKYIININDIKNIKNTEKRYLSLNSIYDLIIRINRLEDNNIFLSCVTIDLIR